MGGNAKGILVRLHLRLLALPLILGLLVGSAAFLPSPARADTSDLPKASPAMAWLAKQTNSAGLLESSAGYGDVGLTLDAVLAGAAAGAPQATMDRWMDGVAAAIQPRVIYDDGAGTLTRDTGTIAKALLALAVTRRSPTSFGGINPRALTEEALTQGGETGWVGAPAQPTGTNAFGQAYAMLGLARTGVLDPATVGFVAAKQCADGGFPMFFTAGKSCAAAGSSSDPDGTAIMIMALRAAQAEGIAAATTPLAGAVSYLTAIQEANGSFRSARVVAGQDPPQNSNTSGLAAAALADLRSDAVAEVRTWMATMQLTSGAEAGAIAHTAADRTKAITTASRGVWVRATTQGVLAFAPVDFSTLTPFSVYTRPGTHTFNGRQWRTRCEPYSQTTRCFTDIWASQVRQENGRFVVVTGWTFNNLSYLPSPRSLWAANNLANAAPGTSKTWTAENGRLWRTECDTAVTGRNGCRAYIWGSFIANVAPAGQPPRYQWKQDWVFNNLVYFS